MFYLNFLFSFFIYLLYNSRLFALLIPQRLLNGLPTNRVRIY